MSRNRGDKAKKKASERTYTPTDTETKAMVKLVHSAPDIYTAILGASLVEFELEKYIKTTMARADDVTWDMLTSDVGPLSTFHRKILLGYAIGLLNDPLLANLLIVKGVRNKFAHPRTILDFNSQSVTDIMQGVALPAEEGNRMHNLFKEVRSAKNTRTAFIKLCFYVNAGIAHGQLQVMEAKMEQQRIILTSLEALQDRLDAESQAGPRPRPQINRSDHA